MRYYRIEITDPATKETRVYASLINGRNDPGALNVEMDVPVVPFATPMGAAFIRVWGISLQAISQASNLNGKSIKVFAGMQKGLPLANPAQAGLIVAGQVQQAFGNWQDVNMTLDLIIQASTGAPGAPKNIVLNWKAGTPLTTALANTLATGFPDLKRTIKISSRLVLPNDETGYYDSLAQFCQYVKGLSRSIIGGDYAGVDIVLRESEFIAFDGSSKSKPQQVAFADLIGQPTWINAGQIQVRCVMRADLTIGDYVKLPRGQVTTTPQSYSQYRQGSVFQGVFQIDLVRHVGNFRQPDANAWVTTLDMHPVPADG